MIIPDGWTRGLVIFALFPFKVPITLAIIAMLVGKDTSRHFTKKNLYFCVGFLVLITTGKYWREVWRRADTKE